MSEDKAKAVAPVLTGLIRKAVYDLGEKETAELLGTSQMRVKHWLLGTHVPPLWVLEKLLDAGKVKLGGGEEDLPAPRPERPIANLDGPMIVGGKCEEADWEGKNLMLCLPWYKSTSPITAFSLMGILDREKMGVLMNCGDAFISHTRNKLARSFLQTKAEWSLWIDDDMILPIGNAAWFNAMTGFGIPDEFAGMHAANRLLSHGKTIVGGLYFGRASSGRPMYAEGASNLAEAQLARRGPQNIVKPTKWVATGCLLIHRTVFEAVDKKFPHLEKNFFSPSEHDLLNSVESLSKVLVDQTISLEDRVKRATTMLNQGRVLSNTNSRIGVGEDVIFCARAAAAGHQPFVDMGLVVGHVGAEVFGPHNTSPNGGMVHV